MNITIENNGGRKLSVNFLSKEGKKMGKAQKFNKKAQKYGIQTFVNCV